MVRSKYHERQKGQSKEVFKLVGGRHVRPASTGKTGERTTIMRGDTLHLTQREADFFGDKFQLVVAPISASVTIDEDEEREIEEQRRADATAAAERRKAAIEEKAVSAKKTTDDDDENIDVSGATGHGGKLLRADFSSQRAFVMWENAGEPDLSGTPRTGHAGSTFSVSDVKKVL